MPRTSTVELTDLELETKIGTYGPDDVAPTAHKLDLTMEISPDLVLIDEDSMERIFDYNPIVAELCRIAGDGHYATQERLMTRIVEVCAAYPEISSLMIYLRKSPVSLDSGAVGIRLSLASNDLRAVRDRFR